jgi:hypothetical protein
MLMPKPIKPQWFLQQLVEMEVARLAPDWPITPVVQYDETEILWDEECEGVGRVQWFCGYLLPPDNPSARAFVSSFNAAMARWRAKYDLGLTCEGRDMLP